MNIVVLQSDGIYGLKKVFVDGPFAIYDRNLVHVVNRSDLYAMDMAVAIRSTMDGATVTTISVGDRRSEELVARSMIKGADRGIWGDCEGASVEDGYGVAAILGKILETHLGGFDVLLMGNSSQDHAFGVAGSELARTSRVRFFGHIAEIRSIARARQGSRFELTAAKLMPKGDRLIFRTVTPAIFGVEGTGTGTHGVGLDDFLARKRKPVERIRVRDLVGAGFPNGTRERGSIKFEGYHEPRRRPKKIYVPDGSLSAADRLKQITSGSVSRKNTDIVAGEPERVSDELVRYLRQKRVI